MKTLTKHSWGFSPPSTSWVHHSTPNASTLLVLRFRLRPSNFDTLLDHLSETSDSFHERYGKHLSKTQVDELMRPSNETLQEVKDWLNWHGVGDKELPTSSDRLISVKIPVSAAETMLNTTYYVFEHTKSQKKTLRTLEYSLPRHLHEHINLVSPTTYFGTIESIRANSFLRSRTSGLNLTGDVTPPIGCVNTITPACLSCVNTTTPTCLKELYNTANYIPSRISRNSIGIPKFQDQYASFSNLTVFTEEFLPQATNATFTVELFDGGQDNQNEPGIEANLDVQYATGLSWPTPMFFCSAGLNSLGESILEWLDFIATVPNDLPPSTFSTTHGDVEQNVPADLATELCSGYATPGVRGTSLMVAFVKPMMARSGLHSRCPYVTTVGGTTGIGPEIASFPSGGGFSNLFARPSYQADAVSAFLIANGNNSAGLFNTTGRAYPDVAAQSQGFEIVFGGKVGAVDGTSCSSVTFAGVIALLNDFKLAKDGTTLGLLNPLLYANPNALNDITIGRNAGCGASGFSAGVGWDPVTGVGTPDFLKLQAIV
ncbi:hypothetical protein GYMLUDRAFT_243087 [Collybiopsis luxurians FD-317 M1]|uniref:Peptidase S53 domain-containing protein n=1 Tax=Collybiopsis luxurians FD-317 M1 TaxID=944289 RepID=A0A0D0BDV5_9AGAR|nr:hypothetical protein GYMLUDRAFT_243087 [Collybiopsis luxurians FD-317 M1]